MSASRIERDAPPIRRRAARVDGARAIARASSERRESNARAVARAPSRRASHARADPPSRSFRSGSLKTSAASPRRRHKNTS